MNKKVMIEGEVYDLESQILETKEETIKVGKYLNDNHYYIYTLYRTKKGKYFMKLEKKLKDKKTVFETDIIYRKEDVKTFLYTKFGVDVYIKYYGDPEEV